MAADDTQKMASIGAEQDIEIELATRPALRLWEGREKTENRYGIIGLPGFCSILRGMEQDIKQDDPYADYHFHRITQAIKELSADLSAELKAIEGFIDESVPPAMKLPEVGSKNPVVIPIRFSSRVGFQMIYQLLKVDQIVLKILLANHIGLMETKEKFQRIARIEKRVRSVLHLAFNFRHTGVNRDDMANNNPKARKAIELMGELEQGYLEGTVRADNAPPLPAKRVNVLSASRRTVA